MEKIILGAGCFWGVQFYFDQIPGVVNTRVGYSGGHVKNPTYEEVCSHNTGHAEVVEVEYDGNKVSNETILKQFFRMHDPTQLNRQGPDIGDNYRSVIFYTTDNQKSIADKVALECQKKLKNPIVTQIERASDFYEAEEYHQKYSERTGRGMCHIPYGPVA
ncbi:MAG: peptide-methionine (S)-S-oxide reductase MsrA [bacterium]